MVLVFYVAILIVVAVTVTKNSLLLILNVDIQIRIISILGLLLIVTHILVWYKYIVSVCISCKIPSSRNLQLRGCRVCQVYPEVQESP